MLKKVSSYVPTHIQTWKAVSEAQHFQSQNIHTVPLPNSKWVTHITILVGSLVSWSTDDCEWHYIYIPSGLRVFSYLLMDRMWVWLLLSYEPLLIGIWIWKPVSNNATIIFFSFQNWCHSKIVRYHLQFSYTSFSHEYHFQVSIEWWIFLDCNRHVFYMPVCMSITGLSLSF